jgi:hypothetical protein
MTGRLLLAAAVLSLILGLASAWVFFSGVTTREQMLVQFGFCTIVWFVCATVWAYTRPEDE